MCLLWSTQQRDWVMLLRLKYKKYILKTDNRHWISVNCLFDFIEDRRLHQQVRWTRTREKTAAVIKLSHDPTTSNKHLLQQLRMRDITTRMFYIYCTSTNTKSN